MSDTVQPTTTGTASWGVSGRVTGVTGIVTSIGVSEDPVLAPEYNEVGAVVKQTKYDEHTTLTATIEVAKSVELPGQGDQITINGKQGYVKTAELAEENTAYRKITVTAEFYKNCNAVSEP